MKHFKFVVFAFVVAQYVFQGEGLPGGGDENKKKFNLKSALLCGSSKASRTSTAIGAGLTIENDGTVNGLGPGTKFTVSNLKEPLQTVTYATFDRAFGLYIHKPKNTVRVSNVFRDLLIAQSENPKNGAINYETAILFLQMFDALPSETIKAMKTMCFLIKRNKEQNGKNKKFDFDKELSVASKTFGPVTKVNWNDIEPKLSRAVRNNNARGSEWSEIVNSLTLGGADLRIPGDQDIEVVDEAVNQATDLAHLISSS